MKLALEFLDFARRVGPHVARVQEPGAEHLEDAAASQLANVGEALDEDSGGDIRRFLRYAKRSGGERERLLLGAAELGCITGRELDEGMRLLKNIRWDLIRLIRWAERSQIRRPVAQPRKASGSEPDAPPGA